MKRAVTFLAVLVIMATGAIPPALAGETPQEVSAAQKLDRLASRLQDSIDEIEFDLSQTAEAIELVGTLDSPEVRTALTRLCAEHRPSLDCAVMDPGGTIAAVEPDRFKHFEGMNVRDRGEVGALLASQRPAMADVFLAAEGYNCIGFFWPLMGAERRFLGMVSTIIRTERISALFVGHEIDATTYDVWVIQPDGKVIYSYRPHSIGKNFMPTGRFAQSKSLADLLKRVAKDQSGCGRFELPPVGHSNPVERGLCWKTVSMNGKELRVVLFHKF